MQELTRRHWRSVAVQVVSKPLLSHGAEVCWRAVERVQVRGHNVFVTKAEAKAKTVTNNLPLLSVLGFRDFNFFWSQKSLFQSGNRPFRSKYFCKSNAWTNEGISFVF